ncbi:MAG TPA: V-type ATP synthase subunit K [Spirochaetales bacterium]|nr:V-type ATP synthase subunit K [Spirochaetales bacterium]
MNIAMIGVAAILGLSAIGSGIGAGIAGQAAIGAWKRAYMANKPAPFLLVAFAGAPLTQTIYGNILMGAMINSQKDSLLLMCLGIIGGLAIGYSAVVQGQAAAASCDAFGETGKGFAQYITVVGICETVALFVMAFMFGAL